MLTSNFRYALRMMRRNPGFSAVAVLSLALGIGANTAIFSIVDAVLLRWLPVKNPQELVVIATLNRDGTPGVSTSYPDYEAFRDRNHSFDGIIAYSGTGPFGFTVKGSAADRRTELVGAVMVSGNYFQVLGVESALGRTLNDEDNRKPGAA
ncbi:MAG: hypothetical protein JWO80_2482, partial [Bryobacterales bacterium]|nr:hypothetical protein [Bryobacterales bacterium]